MFIKKVIHFKKNLIYDININVQLAIFDSHMQNKKYLHYYFLPIDISDIIYN